MQIISDKAVRRISKCKGLLYFHLLPASLMQTIFFFNWSLVNAWQRSHHHPDLNMEKEASSTLNVRNVS